MSQAVELLPWRRFKLTTAKFLSMLWALVLLIAAPPAATESGRTRVLIDAAHHNFHTASERYAPLVKLLEESGFAVASTTAPLTRAVLRTADVVVVANALHVSNVDRWQQPVKPAFSASEIALLTRWVKSGGSLLLIADHFPFPGAIDTLAAAFGFKFVNGFALRADLATADIFDFYEGSLKPHELISGPDLSPPVTRIAAFTGSAFEGPAAAQPLMVLSGGYNVWMTSTAWEFSVDTPKRAGDGLLQGATLSYGKGRVAVFAEAAMFTRQTAREDPQTSIGFDAPTARDNRAFVINLFRWLSPAVSPR